MSHVHYIAIGLYTNSPNFFWPNHLSDQFCHTLLLPSIPAIRYTIIDMFVLNFSWAAMHILNVKSQVNRVHLSRKVRSAFIHSDSFIINL